MFLESSYLDSKLEQPISDCLILHTIEIFLSSITQQGLFSTQHKYNWALGFSLHFLDNNDTL